MKTRTRRLLWVALALAASLGLATAWWVRRFHRYTPAEVVADIRAGIAARHDPQPVERFLELRYGNLADPTNRQNAFLDFFNLGHIQGLQLLSSHLTTDQRKEHSAAMARWIAQYRTTMTAAERQALRDRLGEDHGHAIVRAATSQYLSQDVHYRATSAPVITELLTTLAEIQKP